MKDALTTLVKSSAFSVGIAIASSAFVPANAAFFEFSINEFTGDDAQVNFRVEEIGSDLKFSVNTNDGDLGAVFFDVADESILSSLDVTGLFLDGSFTTDNPTFRASANRVSRVTTGQTNINPQSFDFGVALTGPGASGGNVTSATFILTGSSPLSIDLLTSQRFGARLQNTSGREGSSKLLGISPDDSVTEVPEPFSILGIGTALAFGALYKHGLAQKHKDKASA